MKLHLSIFGIFLSITVNSQQIGPTELISSPKSNNFAISGIGGGNLYELDKNSGSSSAQIAIDWNFLVPEIKTDKKGKKRIQSFSTVFRYNPIITTRLLNKDSLLVKKIPFTDNEYLAHFGLRFRNLKEATIGSLNKENSNGDILNGGFMDLMYTPYNISLTDTTKTGFQTIVLNYGYTIGTYMNNSPVGSFGISVSFSGNYLSILDQPEFVNGFEKSIKVNENLINQLMGFGGKFIFQINDFSIFFELRKYFPMGSGQTITGLTSSPIISFGGVAAGTAFKNKNKKETENYKW